jgi:hypothetical protein
MRLELRRDLPGFQKNEREHRNLATFTVDGQLEAIGQQDHTIIRI